MLLMLVMLLMSLSHVGVVAVAGGKADPSPNCGEADTSNSNLQIVALGRPIPHPKGRPIPYPTLGRPILHPHVAMYL